MEYINRPTLILGPDDNLVEDGEDAVIGDPENFRYFTTSQYAAQIECTSLNVRFWRGFSFSLAWDIIIDTLIGSVCNVWTPGAKTYVALYTATGQFNHIPEELLDYVELTEEGRHQEKKIDPIILNHHKSYIIAMGSENHPFGTDNYYAQVDYWNTTEMLAAEDFLTDWFPRDTTDADDQSLEWHYVGEPDSIVGVTPVLTGGFARARPELGFNHPLVARTSRLQFIEPPIIRREMPKANRVTVISPTNSWTETQPETFEDDIVERTIEIETGTEKTCRDVAKRLLERWGRIQTSVEGKIELYNNFDFKVKAEVVIGDSLIIGEHFIIQEVEHNIEEYFTKVKLGDIILDDEEMLARILEEIK